MNCAACSSRLAAANELFFYEKSAKEVHLALRPECRPLLERSMRLLEATRKGAKVVCRRDGCEAEVGKEVPFGPGGALFVAFALSSVVLLGSPLPRKRKWSEVRLDAPFRSIERRSDDGFLGRPEPPQAASSGADGMGSGRPARPIPVQPASLEDFAWDGLTLAEPRSYQIEAFVEALSRNVIVVIPTGGGKTLVASMILARMRRLNRDHMGLFVVDRIPLVFQQAVAIAAETGLRVCKLCSENRTKATIHELNDGAFDLLVVTGGSLREMLRRSELSLEVFSVVVFDEAHHATGEHCYAGLLEAIRAVPRSRRPRLVGLTASPCSAQTTKQAGDRLQLLQDRFDGAVLFKPPMPPAAQTTEWAVIDPSREQHVMLQRLVEGIHQGAAALNETGGTDLVGTSWLTKELLLQDPGALGRLRGMLRAAQDEFRLCGGGPAVVQHGLLALHLAAASVEVCLVIGPADAHKVLSDAPVDGLPWVRSLLEAPPSAAKSPQVLHLLALLGRAPAASRVLVFVDTRATARRLCDLLRAEPSVAGRFSPDIVVGHGGADGMDWFGGQDAALAAFAEGETRLLVCTSVLEEGLDVAACDLVVRFQGVGSLISLVQSRGRARKQHSRLVVVLPSAMRTRVLEMEDRERLMNCVLEQRAAQDRVPCARTQERIRELGRRSSTGQPGAPATGERSTREAAEQQKPRLVVKLVCFANGRSEEKLKEAILNSLEAAALGLGVQRIEAVPQAAAVSTATASAFGRDDAVVLVKLKGDTVGGSGQSAAACYQALCRGWDFGSTASPPVTTWAQLVDGEMRSGRSVQSSWPVDRVAIGRFEDRRTFCARFEATDGIVATASIAFSSRHHVEICVPDVWNTLDRGALGLFGAQVGAQVQHIFIRVDLRTLAGFGLLSWDRVDAVTLYLQLLSVPVVGVAFMRGELLHEERICGLGDHPLLAALAADFALAVRLPLEQRQVLELRALLSEAEAMPAPIFDARVAEVTRPRQRGFSLEERLDCLNADQPGVRECHWALGVLATTCPALSSECLDAIAQTCCELADDRMGSLNPLLGWEESVTAATAAVYAAAEACEGRSWPSASEAFNAALGSFRKVSSGRLRRFQLTPGPNQVLLKRVVVTPSRVVLLPAVPVQTSRLLRRFQHLEFVSVHFLEEQLQSLRGTETLTNLESVLTQGFTVGGTRFHYFGSSASQLRAHSAMFVAVENACPRPPRPLGEVWTLRDDIVRDRNAFRSIAKYMARLGLYMTADTPAVDLDPCDTYRMDDARAEDGALLTDGAGKASRLFAEQVKDALGLAEAPCAMQFRWAGMKGVVLTVGDDDWELCAARAGLGRACRLVHRPSMHKFECDDHGFCVVSCSAHRTAHLNREVITLLTSLKHALSGWDASNCWDPEAAAIERQEAALRDAAGMFVDEERAAAELADAVPLEWRALVREAQARMSILVEPFWLSMLSRIYRLRVRDLATKARIPLPHSDAALLLGVPDPCGVLRDGEAFVQVEYPVRDPRQPDGAGTARKLVTGDLLVHRNPCLHPGDLQRLRAVDRPELRSLKNVLVLPVVGRRSVAACCSGGDLDGDMFSVIWAADLVPPSAATHPALDYDAILAEAGAAVGSTAESSQWEDKDLVHFFCRVVVNDTLGRIAHTHLALSDMLPRGAMDPLAIELAKSQSLAVDFPKTGVPPEVPEDALKEVSKQGYPDFMQKPFSQTYTSEKVLGLLFRRCVSLDTDYETAAAFDVDEALLLPERLAWREKAAQACSMFELELRRLMVSHGLRHETEAILATPLRWHPTAADRGKASHRIRAHFSLLLQKHREAFFEGLREPDYCPKASACYEAAYRPAPGGRSCRCFAWVVGDVLCQIKAGLASPASGPACDRVHELVGESALRHVQLSLPEVESMVRSKLAVLETVQSALNAYCASLLGGAAAEQVFEARAFGSTSIFLCEPESDLDICITPCPSAYLPPFVPAAIASQFDSLDAAARQRHFLQTVVSPALDSVAHAKREALQAPVPVLRLVLPGVIDAEEQVRVDVVLSQDGLGKARHFRAALYARLGPAAFAAALLMTSWARGVGLVRSQQAEAPAAAGSGAPLQAAMVPGEWYALLVHLCQAVVDGGQARARATGAAPAGAAAGAEDASADALEGALQRLADGVAGLRPGRLGEVGRLLLGLLGAAAAASGDLTLTWPVEGRPQHTLPARVVSAVAGLARQAGEVLSATRSWEATLATSAADKAASITRRLSRSLSFRIHGHCAFHEAHLHAVSGAVVHLEEEPDSDLLLLRATGVPAAIQRLQRELQRYTHAAVAVGAPHTKASRYFMEGSTRVFFEGAPSPAARLRFQAALCAHHPAHSACERQRPQLNSPEPGTAWEVAARARFLDMWAAQVGKLPVHSSSHMESLSVSARFGVFYATDVTDKLPETSLTMSAAELEEAMVKHRRNRKSCWREFPNAGLPARGGPDASGNAFDKTPIQPSKGLVGNNAARGRRKHKRSRQPGLGTSFCPGLLPSNRCEEELRLRCAGAYKAALRGAGFREAAAPHSRQGTWKASFFASQAFELQVHLDASLGVTGLDERPLCWAHATLVGGPAGAERQRLLRGHDVRLKVETSDPVPLDSPFREQVLPGGGAPIEVRNGLPAPSPRLPHRLQDRVAFARRLDRAEALRLPPQDGRPEATAEVLTGSDFVGRKLQLRRDFCELSLKFSQGALRAALLQGGGAVRAYGDHVWQTSLAVSRALREAVEASERPPA
ncbi:unnamed protein product [Prorocentrum cordatum]|uniref:RNA-directed RNA polymerase n=1 Tax=Prorocentrum cordatum TaxID=2364126 RepID=A0ABN9RQ57_9DINO|nr:unnamed protein product [Polarella glacialis]